MIVTIKIPDELYETYAEFNPSNPRQAIEKQLERFKDFDTSKRVLVFSDSTRRSLEQIYGTPIEDQEKFASWVKDLISVKLGELDIPLRAGQLKALRAQGNGGSKSPEVFMRDRIQVALDRELGIS